MINARTTRPLAAALGAAVLAAGPAAAQYQVVDLSGVVDTDYCASGPNLGGCTNYLPAGTQTLNGVPFTILHSSTTGSTLEWGAYTAANGGSSTASVTVPVGVFGVTRAYSLINTLWGGAGGRYQTVTFTGSGGASFVETLVAGVDVRDFNQDGYANTINGTSTVQVFAIGTSQRLDRQEYDLPGAFASQTLESVTFTDTGAPYVSRMFLSALTVGGTTVTTPEPAAATLVAGGLTLIGFAARRRRTRLTGRPVPRPEREG